MKKALCLTGTVLAASLILCQSAAAGADRVFSVAASFGTYPVPIMFTIAKPHAFRGGLEIGYQISGRLRVSGEFQYVDWSTYTRVDDTDTGDYQSVKQSYVSTPILLSLTYVTPIDETFTLLLGAGAGYHPFTIKSHSVLHVGGVDVVDDLLEYGGHGIVPHISLGLETALSKRISVFGQVRQLVGTFRYERTEENVEYESRLTNSGIELLAGVRIYI